MVLSKKEVITDISQLDLNGRYTYEDYLGWKFDEMVELIKGKIFRMSPAPSTNHQEISSYLHIKIGTYFIKKQCKLFAAPFDVRFPSNKKKKTETVVKPDLCVVCDLDKLDKKGCVGAPDWVIEILSPGNIKKEMREKFDLYEEYGVKEYWLVRPEEKSLIIYSLNEQNKYIGSRTYTEDEKVNSVAFPELELNLIEVFDTLDRE